MSLKVTNYTQIEYDVYDANNQYLRDNTILPIKEAVARFRSACRFYRFDSSVHAGVEHIDLKLKTFIPGTVMPPQFPHKPMDGLGHERNLRELVGFDAFEFKQPLTLNQPSFSRSNAHRSYRLWSYLFHRLWARAKTQCALPQLVGLGQVVAVDGCLFDCLARMSWAVYRSCKPKVKGHFFFNLDGLPERLVLTTGLGT